MIDPKEVGETASKENRAFAKQLGLVAEYMAIGQPQKALASLTKITDSDFFESGIYWVLMSQIQFDLEDYPKAISAAKKGLANEPESTVLLEILSRSYTEVDDLESAENTILQAIKLEPEDPSLLSQYALMLALGGQVEKAQKVLQRAKKYDPEGLTTRRAEGVLSYYIGDTKSSLESHRDILKDNPDDEYSHMLTGAALLEQGNMLKGNRHIKHAVQQNPDEEAFRNLAREGRRMTHWAMWPLWPVQKFGPVALYVFFAGGILLLRAFDLTRFATYFAMFYLGYCIYSWVVPRIIRKFL